jgi:AcrR family transcriptional regulator
MNDRAEDTKTRILKAACSLFAKAGYDGASVRNIAKDAGVNVAAVNYHFNTKSTLYWENYRQSLLWLEENFEAISKTCSNSEDFAVKMFDLLYENSETLLNTFKMILSGSVPPPEGEHLEFCNSRAMTPPGGKFLGAMIVDQLGRPIVEDDLLFAVKSIFTVVVHWTLLAGSSQSCHFRQSDKIFHPDVIRRDIRRHTKIIVESLRLGS